MIEKVRTNRKTTRGRNIYYQDIFDDKGKRIKTIKHIQVSPTRLMIAEKMVNIYEHKNNYTPSTNPNTIKVKNKRNRPARVLWDSYKHGTYVKALHGELV